MRSSTTEIVFLTSFITGCSSKFGVERIALVLIMLMMSFFVPHFLSFPSSDPRNINYAWRFCEHNSNHIYNTLNKLFLEFNPNISIYISL